MRVYAADANHQWKVYFKSPHPDPLPEYRAREVVDMRFSPYVFFVAEDCALARGLNKDRICARLTLGQSLGGWLFTWVARMCRALCFFVSCR